MARWTPNSHGDHAVHTLHSSPPPAPKTPIPPPKHHLCNATITARTVEGREIRAWYTVLGSRPRGWYLEGGRMHGAGVAHTPSTIHAPCASCMRLDPTAHPGAGTNHCAHSNLGVGNPCAKAWGAAHRLLTPSLATHRTVCWPMRILSPCLATFTVSSRGGSSASTAAWASPQHAMTRTSVHAKARRCRMPTSALAQHPSGQPGPSHFPYFERMVLALGGSCAGKSTHRIAYKHVRGPGAVHAALAHPSSAGADQGRPRHGGRS